MRSPTAAVSSGPAGFGKESPHDRDRRKVSLGGRSSWTEAQVVEWLRIALSGDCSAYRVECSTRSTAVDAGYAASDSPAGSRSATSPKGPWHTRRALFQVVLLTRLTTLFWALRNAALGMDLGMKSTTVNRGNEVCGGRPGVVRCSVGQHITNDSPGTVEALGSSFCRPRGRMHNAWHDGFSWLGY
jgi:hypothetical protein